MYKYFALCFNKPIINWTQNDETFLLKKIEVVSKSEDQDKMVHQLLKADSPAWAPIGVRHVQSHSALIN
jgi:hypothetical protein